MTTYTMNEWRAKGKELFGENFLTWRFVCPICKKEQSAQDFNPQQSRAANPSNAYRRCLDGASGDHGCDLIEWGVVTGPDCIVLSSGKEMPVFAFARP